MRVSARSNSVRLGVCARGSTHRARARSRAAILRRVRPGVIAPGDQREFVVGQRLAVQVVRELRRAQRAQDEVEVARAQVRRERLERSFDRRHAQARMLPDETGDRLGQEARAAEGQGAHVHHALVEAPQRRDVRGGVADLGHGPLQAKGERRAGGRGDHPARRALEQRRADAFLQLPHGHADGRLRDADALRHRRHVVLVAQRHEGAHAPLVREHVEDRRIALASLARDGGDLGARVLHLRLHPLRPHQQRAAELGQQHAARAALEQRDVEFPLELADRPRDGRLRAKDGGARAVRAALLGDGEECAKVT